MSILIKGMEMPTKENAVILITPSGAVWMIGDMPNEDTRLVKAKAVPVPPHGRLGDLDKLAEKIEGIWDCNDLYFQPNDKICDPEDCKGCKWRETWDCFRRMVKHTPTIIPAEEERA